MVKAFIKQNQQNVEIVHLLEQLVRAQVMNGTAMKTPLEI